MFVTRGMFRSTIRPLLANMKANKFSMPLLATFQNTSVFSPLSSVSRTFVSSNVNMSDIVSDAPINYQVYIGNLPFETEKDQLTELVSPAVGLKNVRFLTDPEGRSRGFAYLDFQSQAEAVEATKTLAGLEISGRALKVDYSEPRSKDAPRGFAKAFSYSVFIGNIDVGVSESLIKEMLDEVLGADTADRIRVAVDRETGRQKGFAHIDFRSEDLARRAVTELNGIELMGRVLRIDYATSKNDGKTAGATTGGGSGSTRAFNPNQHSVFLGIQIYMYIYIYIYICIYIYINKYV
jgi:RNA recognition motif-containing protein